MAKYIEIVEGSIENRGRIVDYDTVKATLVKKRDHCCYNSMFLFEDDIVEHLNGQKEAGVTKPSVSGYAGRCSMNYLWIDVDTDNEETTNVLENIKNTLDATKRILDGLIMKYAMKEDNFAIYFSGNKGFHIGIPAQVFGAEFYSSEAVPTIAKIFAREICDNNKMVDYKIYNTVRIFRTPLSKHEKTGLYKVAVSYNTITLLDAGRILELSSNCQNEKTKLTTDVNLSLKAIFDKCCNKSVTQVDILQSVKSTENKSAYNSSVFKMPPKGGRNNALMKMAVRLFAVPKENLSNNEVIDLMRMIADAINNVSLIRGWEELSEQEIRALINNGFKYTRLKQTISGLEAVAMSELTSRVFQYAMNAKYIPLGIPTFDEDMGDGAVLGNLYAVIGRAGTLKSIWMQDIAIEAAKKGLDGVFFNQEMSENEIFERTCRKVLQMNFIEMVKNGDVKQEDIEKIVHDIEDVIGKRMKVVSKTDLSHEDMSNIIKNEEEQKGTKLYYAITDSLSGMKMISNDEVTSAVQNSKYLKEGAKERNVAWFLICHTNAMCPVTARDASTFVRGGTKTIDNCDGYFTLSKIVDKERSNFESHPQDIVYMPGYTYIRFVNKRHSGNTLDRVVYLDDTFSIVEAKDNPIFYNSDKILL